MSDDAINPISFDSQASSGAPIQAPTAPTAAQDAPAAEAPAASINQTDTVSLSSSGEDHDGAAPAGLLQGMATNYGEQPSIAGQDGQAGGTGEQPIQVAMAGPGDNGIGASEGQGAPPASAPGQQGGGPNPQTVDLIRQGGGALPGGNPGAGPLGLIPGRTGTASGIATPGGIPQIHQQVLPQAFNPINDALTGRPPAGAQTHLGSNTMTSGIFSSTPQFTFRVNGENATLAMPSVSAGQTVNYYRVSAPGGGYQIQARSGNTTWNLQGGPNTIAPWLVGSSWSWARQR